jgi:hypothetical protein
MRDEEWEAVVVVKGDWVEVRCSQCAERRISRMRGRRDMVKFMVTRWCKCRPNHMRAIGEWCLFGTR